MVVRWSAPRPERHVGVCAEASVYGSRHAVRAGLLEHARIEEQHPEHVVARGLLADLHARSGLQRARPPGPLPEPRPVEPHRQLAADPDRGEQLIGGDERAEVGALKGRRLGEELVHLLAAVGLSGAGLALAIAPDELPGLGTHEHVGFLQDGRSFG